VRPRLQRGESTRHFEHAEQRSSGREANVDRSVTVALADPGAASRVDAADLLGEMRGTAES